MNVSGLIIASGLSTRINGFKPLLQYNEKSFLINITEKLLTILPKVIVIVGFNYDKLLDEFNNHYAGKLEQVKDKSWQIEDRIKIIFNQNYKVGMFTSLQLGVKDLSDSDWILYHFIDQPNLPKEFYSEILKQQTKSYNWVQPIYNKIKGHPVMFDKKIALTIKDSDPTSNLREILKDESIQKYFWNCNFPQILEDIDTDYDYERLLRKIK